MRYSLLFAPALAGLLVGCTVGPDYAGPPKALSDTPAARTFARAGDLPVTAPPPVARWWETLADPVLNEVEQRALAANPDLAGAEARLRQARAALREQKANLLPKADATLLYAHARFPGVNFGSSGNSSNGGDDTDLNLYNLGFDASWEVDLFGGQRRAIEAARATAEAAAANLADAQVSLSAEVAQAYLNIRDRQARIMLNREAVARQARMLDLTRQRLDQGTASRLDVARLSQQLEATRADSTPLTAELDAYLDELATLTGEVPGALDPLLTPPRPLPLPPASVPVGDPAALLQRRPDIRAAERTLAANTAKIGQAVAARFPRVSFMGIIGLGGTKPGDMVDLDNFTALIAPQLSWSFLDFGRSAARVRQMRATRDEAEAKYRSTVLAALRDANDSLSRFRARRITVATLARAKGSADEAASLSHQRYQAGTTTLIDVLDTERQQIEAAQNLSVAKAGLTSDYIAIQKALGLGWGAPISPANTGGSVKGK